MQELAQGGQRGRTAPTCGGGHKQWFSGGSTPWHICSPSLATIETTEHNPKRRPMHTVALGLTKAMHEFLTLHYFATDSAAGWNDLMAKRLLDTSLPNTDERRQTALDMFYKCHIAPSYRRLPHSSWTTCLSLLIDLLIGAGKTRYLALGHLLVATVKFLCVAFQLAYGNMISS